MAAALAAVSLLAGCATVPGGKHAPGDPFESVNRSIYKFNYRRRSARVFRPVARGWKAVVPAPLRRGLSNFISNLAAPGHDHQRPAAGQVHAGRARLHAHADQHHLRPRVLRSGDQGRARAPRRGLRADARQVGRAGRAPTSCCRCSGLRACATRPRGSPTNTRTRATTCSTRHASLGVWVAEKVELRASLLEPRRHDRPRLRPVRLRAQCLGEAPRIPGARWRRGGRTRGRGPGRRRGHRRGLRTRTRARTGRRHGADKAAPTAPRAAAAQ